MEQLSEKTGDERLSFCGIGIEGLYKEQLLIYYNALRLDLNQFDDLAEMAERGRLLYEQLRGHSSKLAELSDYSSFVKIDLETVKIELQILLISFHFINCLALPSERHLKGEDIYSKIFERQAKSLPVLCLRVDQDLHPRFQVLDLVRSGINSLVGIIGNTYVNLDTEESRRADELRRLVLAVKFIGDIKEKFILIDGVEFTPDLWPRSLCEELIGLCVLIEDRLRVLMQ